MYEAVHTNLETARAEGYPSYVVHGRSMMRRKCRGRPFERGLKRKESLGHLFCVTGAGSIPPLRVGMGSVRRSVGNRGCY